MSFTPFDPELAKLVANLPQAASLDLYRIEVAAHKLSREPQRILQVRRHLHLGMDYSESWLKWLAMGCRRANSLGGTKLIQTSSSRTPAFA